MLGLFDSGGGGCCSRAAGIKAGGDWTSSGPSPHTLILVVPDGVAKVTVLLSPGPASKPSHAVTANVHGNVAAFLSPYAVENLGVDKMIWRAADGHVIKREARALPEVVESRINVILCPVSQKALRLASRCPSTS